MSEQLQDASSLKERGRITRLKEKTRERLSWHSTVRAVGGAALFAVPSAALAGALAYKMESRDTTIASFDSTIRLAHDGYVTFDAEPLTSIRVPSHEPGGLGVNVRINQSQAPNTSILVQEGAALGAQPRGETEKIRDATQSLLIDIGEAGVFGGFGGIALYSAIGHRRRRELIEKYGSKATRVALVGMIATACAASNAPAASPIDARDPAWQNIETVFPDFPADLSDMGIQISSNVVSSRTANLIRGMIASYERSTTNYSDMEELANELGPELRQPGEGELVALLISDRHDNIGMDPVNAAIGKAGGADIVLDAGDDTSSGQPWEEFSLASLTASFKDFKYRIGVAGNHDPGTFVSDYLSKAKNGFTMLDHDETMADGLRVRGYGDLRSSSLVNSVDFASTDLSELEGQIVKETCDADAAGTRINVLLIHQASIAEDALKAGCVDLILGGHLHRYKGPTAFTGTNGEIGYSFTTDTAGGAALAMALGPLRRSAGVTLVTFDMNGEEPDLVGFQKVMSLQDGTIAAQPFEYVESYETDSTFLNQLKADKKYPDSKIATKNRLQHN